MLVPQLHLDLYVRSPYAHGVTRDPARRGWAQHRAGLDVVDGPVPRARDLLARHLALGERAAAVRAGVVDGVEAPLQVEEGDLLPRHLDVPRLARSEVGGTRDLDELRHVNLLLRSELHQYPARHDHGTTKGSGSVRRLACRRR